jgi:hypothetical protein
MKYSVIVLAIMMFSCGVVFAAAFHQSETRTAFGGEKSIAVSQDRVTGNQIHLYKDKLVIAAEGLMYAKVEDTKSMEPLLSKNSHTIEAAPVIENLKVGDIISFYEPSVDKVVVHMIIEIGYDEQGWYARTSGYNNVYADSWKVRFENIKGVVVGVLN